MLWHYGAAVVLAIATGAMFILELYHLQEVRKLLEDSRQNSARSLANLCEAERICNELKQQLTESLTQGISNDQHT